MQLVKLYVRLMKNIRPLLLFYVMAFCLVVVGLYVLRENGSPDFFFGEEIEAVMGLPEEKRDFLWNLNQFQCYMNALCFLLVMVIVSGCGFFLQIIHDRGIYKRSRMFPISARKQNLQIILANVLYTVFMDLLFTFAGVVMFGYLGLGQMLGWYFFNTLVFSLTMVSVSYLVGFLMKKKESVFIFSILYAGVSCFAGGLFIPQGRFNTVLVRIAEFTPSYWFVRGNAVVTAAAETNILSMGDISKCLFMQFFWAAAFLALAGVIEKERHKLDLY